LKKTFSKNPINEKYVRSQRIVLLTHNMQLPDIYFLVSCLIHEFLGRKVISIIFHADKTTVYRIYVVHKMYYNDTIEKLNNGFRHTLV